MTPNVSKKNVYKTVVYCIDYINDIIYTLYQ